MKRHLLSLSLLTILCLLAVGHETPAQVPGEDRELAKLEQDILERPYFSSRNGVFRRYAVQMLVQNTPERGLWVMRRFFQQEFGDGRRQLASRNRRLMYVRAGDAYILLRLVAIARPRVEFKEDITNWLFSSDDALRHFLENVSPADNFPVSWSIIDKLYRHDPQRRDRFRNLILAMAFVWDQQRPPLHQQMGGRRLPYQPQIAERYDYFRNLYASGQAEISYSELSVTALTFVVDTPVPVTELEWALENVRGRANSWGDHFTGIDYDRQRIFTGRYQWPHGPYTLAAIRKHGGICVEQGYYATITARAHGIPALLFVGQGRRGPHAWMGYLRDRGEWVLDVGRYERDKYATGIAYNPQTSQPMTDHDLMYVCDRAVNPPRYRAATAYARLAVALVENGLLDAASDAASRSAAEVSIYELPWQLQEKILAEQGKQEELMQLLDQKANVFREYPDFVAAIRSKQAQLLRAAGQDRRAEAFLRQHRNLLDSQRDDLERMLATEQIRVAYEDGDFPKARREFERLLSEHRDEGAKLLWFIELYLEFTVRTDQEDEAARFLKGYVNDLLRRYQGTGDQNVLLQYLAQAYRNAGRTDQAESLERRRR